MGMVAILVFDHLYIFSFPFRCDGSGQTSSAGASYNLNDSRARAYCNCSGVGWGLFGFFSPLPFLSSFSLCLGDGPISLLGIGHLARRRRTIDA